MSKKQKPKFEGKFRLRKGDEVIVLSGKDKGKHGKIIETLRTEGKVRVDGVKIVRKHQKPRGTSSRAMVKQQMGEIEFPMGISIAKVMFVCPKCNKESRLASGSAEGGEAGRLCKKCGEVVD